MSAQVIRGRATPPQSARSAWSGRAGTGRRRNGRRSRRSRWPAAGGECDVDLVGATGEGDRHVRDPARDRRSSQQALQTPLGLGMRPVAEVAVSRLICRFPHRPGELLEPTGDIGGGAPALLERPVGEDAGASGREPAQTVEHGLAAGRDPEARDGWSRIGVDGDAVHAHAVRPVEATPVEPGDVDQPVDRGPACPTTRAADRKLSGEPVASTANHAGARRRSTVRRRADRRRRFRGRLETSDAQPRSTVPGATSASISCRRVISPPWRRVMSVQDTGQR